MGKAAKKNQDFKKVKLKVGKKLNRPNETRTDFKARKLVLLGQLDPKNKSATGQSEELELLSHRKLNVKELCQHLRHHNVNVRKDALSSLKDIILRQNYEQLRTNLKFLLENLFVLVTDLDFDVRNLLFSVLKEIFVKVRQLDVSPSLQLITAHVVCASTHFNSNVKLFAVKIIGLLIDKLPDLCRRNVKLLKSFADLLCFKEKNVSRQAKSTLVSCLESLLRVNYGLFREKSNRNDENNVAARKTAEIDATTAELVADIGEKNICLITDQVQLLQNNEQQQQLVIANPTSCSLISGEFSYSANPFDFSIYSDNFAATDDQLVLGSSLSSSRSLELKNDSGHIDLGAFCYVAEKSISFCHAFWLELTTTDESSKMDSEEANFFDSTTLLDLERILNIYEILFDRLSKVLDEEALPSDTSLTSDLTKLKEKYLKNDKFFNRYAKLFPCREKRDVNSGGPKNNRNSTSSCTISTPTTGSSCRRVNLSLCRFMLKSLSSSSSEFKPEIRDYLTKIGSKGNKISENVLVKIDSLLSMCCS